MCWAAFSSSCKIQMCFISTKMNSKMYTDLLEDILIPFMDDNIDGNAILQQDNASIHVSTLPKLWLTDHNITYLDWPSCSPDMNPIENLWGIQARRVYQNGHQFDDVTSLKQEITNACSTIGQKTLQALSKSMSDRIFAVARANGNPTKY